MSHTARPTVRPIPPHLPSAQSPPPISPPQQLPRLLSLKALSRMGQSLPDFGPDTVNRATAIAFVAHHGQTRKDGVTPQAFHPLHVQRLLAQTGITDASVHALALLHDAVEDNPGPRGQEILELIYSQVGPDVAAMVQLLTDEPGLDDQTRKIEQARKLVDADWRVQVVKLADAVAGVQEGPAPHWGAAKVARYVAAQRSLVHTTLKHSHTELAFYFNHGLQQPVWALAGEAV